MQNIVYLLFSSIFYSGESHRLRRKTFCVRSGVHFKIVSIVSTKCARVFTYEGGCVGTIRLYCGGSAVIHEKST